jgi:serine protease AprX
MDRSKLVMAFSGLFLLSLIMSASYGWSGEMKTDRGPFAGYAKIDGALIDQMDKGMDMIPVIIIFEEGEIPTLDETEIRYTYHLISGVAGFASPSTIKRLSEEKTVAGIYLDSSVSAAGPVEGLESAKTVNSAEMVGAHKLWEKGIDGSGVVIAVIDSGIHKSHPDLAGKVIGEKNFVESEKTTDDLLGHGTLCAGIIAGSGAASNGEYKGVAPGAKLLNVRVIDSSGNGQVSDIIAGIEWAIDNNADVLSLSLAGMNLGETNPPVSMAADNAMDAGVVVCVAAGNRG